MSEHAPQGGTATAAPPESVDKEFQRIVSHEFDVDTELSYPIHEIGYNPDLDVEGTLDAQVIIHDRVWGTSLTDEYADDETPNENLPIEIPPTRFSDVYAAVDAGLEAFSLQKPGKKSERAYRNSIAELVEPINNNPGIDNLAYLSSGYLKMQEDLVDKLAPDEELSGNDLERYKEIDVYHKVIGDMVDALPEKSRDKYYDKLDAHNDDPDTNLEMLSEDEIAAQNQTHEPDDTADLETGHGHAKTDAHDEPKEPKQHLLKRGKEAVWSKRSAKILGAVAVGGLYYGIHSYAVAKGIINPDHAQALHDARTGGGGQFHMQLLGNRQATNPDRVSLGPPAPDINRQGTSVYTSGEDKLSYAEVASEYGIAVALAIGGVTRAIRKNKEARSHEKHMKHLVHEEHREAANHLAVATLVEDNPTNARLLEAMKHPLVLNELRDKGIGPTESKYSTDILVRYARIIAPKVGGTAEGVKKHFETLGISIGESVFADAMTPSGHTTITIENENHAEIANMAEQLLQGDLRLRDIPPTSKFFGDPEIKKALKEITAGSTDEQGNKTEGLYSQMQWAAEHPYTRKGYGPTAHQLAYQIDGRVRGIFTKLASSLPTDAARHAALQALNLGGFIEEFTPEEGKPSSFRVKRSGSGAVSAASRLVHTLGSTQAVHH
jgi:hypothetical protein